MNYLKLAFLWSSALLMFYGQLCYSQGPYDYGGGSGPSSFPGAPGGYPPPPAAAHNCVRPELPICADSQQQDCCPDRCICPFPSVRRKSDKKCVEKPPVGTSNEVDCPQNEIPICADQINLKDCCPDRCMCPLPYVRRKSDKKCVENKRPVGTPPEVDCPQNEIPICADQINLKDCCPDRCMCLLPYVRRKSDKKCVENKRPVGTPPEVDCPENEIPICADQQNLKDCCPDRCECPPGFVRLESEGGKCVKKNRSTQPGQANRQHEIAICANGDTMCCSDKCQCPSGFIRLSKENGRCIKECPKYEVPVCANGDEDCCPEQCRCPAPYYIRYNGICRPRGRRQNGNQSSCPPNEVPICATPNKDCCSDRCRCPKDLGYVRLQAQNGACVFGSPLSSGDTGSPDCPPNEVPICEKSADSPPITYCCSDRCKCPGGFVRKNCNGECVKE